MLKPRFLRLLRINDSAKPFDQPDSNDAPPGLSGFSVGRVNRITGTEAHQSFWSEVELGQAPPDIVLVDLNFEKDLGEPMKAPFKVTLSDPNAGSGTDGLARAKPLVNVPTGLLHAIPFLTWGRVTGRIVAHYFHTGWTGLASAAPGASTGGAGVLTLGELPELGGLMCASLGGVAGAISGSLAPRVVSATNMQAAFDWIGEVFANSEEAARRLAHAEWRKKLMEAASPVQVAGGRPYNFVIVDPVPYVQLLKALEDILRTPPVDTLTDEAWPGLSITYADGTKDCISLASIFADAEGGVQSADCAETGDTESPAWKLRGGRPAIARFARELGGWHDTFRDAVEVAEQLPLGTLRASDSLNVVTSSKKNKDLVRLVVIAFQMVRQHQAAAKWWVDNYLNTDWDLAAGRFAYDGQGQDTLPVLLSRFLAEAVRDLESGKSTATGEPLFLLSEDATGEIRDRLKIPGDGVKMYLNLLQEFGVLTQTTEVGLDGAFPQALVHVRALMAHGAIQGSIRQGKFVGDSLRLSALFTMKVPSRPASVRPDWMSSDGVVVREILAENLGFPPENLGQVYRIPATVLGKEVSGAAFLTAFEKGESTAHWLRALCREYATGHRDWREKESWPAFLR